MDFMLRSSKKLAATCTVIAILLWGGPARSEASLEVSNKAYWMCKQKNNVRTIRIQIDNQGICSTIYSKEGSEKLIGSGKSHVSCTNFLANVKTNLEKSNWVCRDIGDTKITADID